ncbi:MAG: type 1 glutamine amidotransferase [Marinibacterium sp.]|nr:type 1 glutamine amidotransferase [Marinibacterium sp.]
MKIGILQTGHAPDALIAETGDYDLFFERLLGGHGFTFHNFPVVDGVFPPGVEAADAWLITGSRHGAYEDHDWIPPLDELVRAIHASGRPMVGICFGHQIIAQALGGKVEKFDGGWSVGRVEYDTPEGPLAVNAWHQDQVTELPPGARVLGATPFCKNAILAYGNRILTYQPHPEFEADFVVKLAETRGRGVVPDTLLDAAIAEKDQPLDSGKVANDIAAFFKAGQKA